MGNITAHPEPQRGHAPQLGAAATRGQSESITPSAARAAALRSPAPEVPIRLAFVLDTVETWQAGTEKHVYQVLKALDRRLFTPELYVLRPSESLKPEEVPCPLHVVSSQGYRGWRHVTALIRLTRLLRRQRPQIAQCFFVDGVLLGTVAAWLARVPVIVATRRNAGYFLNRVLRVALRMADFVVDVWQCNSGAVSAALQECEGVRAGKIRILRNAIDGERFKPASPACRQQARERLKLPTDVPVFVAVANLRPVKRLDTLVEAARCVRRKLSSVRFLIVGEGPLRSVLSDQIARLGLEGTVRLEGRQESVIAYLAAADFGILSSASEGCSNSLLEYMACGLPAVVSDIPANRELMPGEFFPVGDAEALAEAIVSLWSDQNRQAQLRQAYLDRVQAFGRDAVIQAIQSFYLGLAQRELDRTRA